jgi:hypothetical protein
LPPGTYELAEVQPIFYIDGKDSLGEQISAVNDRFSGLVMNADSLLIRANFGELGVRPEFISAFGNRRAFFASTTPGGDDLNLAGGELWYSFDGGFADLLNAVADVSGGAGTTTLTLLISNLA